MNNCPFRIGTTANRVTLTSFPISAVFRIDSDGKAGKEPQKCWLQWSDSMFEEGVHINIGESKYSISIGEKKICTITQETLIGSLTDATSNKFTDPPTAATLSRVSNVARTAEFIWSPSFVGSARIVLQPGDGRDSNDIVFQDRPVSNGQLPQTNGVALEKRPPVKEKVAVLIKTRAPVPVNDRTVSEKVAAVPKALDHMASIAPPKSTLSSSPKVRLESIPSSSSLEIESICLPDCILSHMTLGQARASQSSRGTRGSYPYANAFLGYLWWLPSTIPSFPRPQTWKNTPYIHPSGCLHHRLRVTILHEGSSQDHTCSRSNGLFVWEIPWLELSNLGEIVRRNGFLSILT